MNREILNDEKIIEELHGKLSEHEVKLKDFTEQKQELNTTLDDLNRKSSEYDDDISDSTREKMEEVKDKVKEKIDEIDSEITDLNNKIKEINETLNPTPETQTQPEPEIPEIPKLPSELEIKEAKVKELREKKNALEEEKVRRSSEIENKTDIIEGQRKRLEETLTAIEEKMDSRNINEATRDRLEEMRDEVQEKIDELDEKIDELHESLDNMQDEIDELCGEIEDLCDEIEEIREGTVDENIINEVKKSTGFDDLNNLLNKITDTVNAALFGNINNIKMPEIKIPPIPEIKIKIPGQNYSNNSNQNKNKKSEQKYNINFASSQMGASVYSVCCENSHGERSANLIDGDMKFNEKWCATHDHGTRKVVSPHWVIVDFGEVKTFNYLKLVKSSTGDSWHGDVGRKDLDASAWRFEISNDKEHWVEFNRETDDNSAVYEKRFGQMTGRYVRLFVDRAGSDGNVRLHELRFEMHDEDGNIINLCENPVIESCCDAGREEHAARYIMGSNNPGYKKKWYTIWRHEENIPQYHWIIIDLGQTRSFNNIKIAKASVGRHDFGDRHKDMSAFRLQISDDGDNFTEFIEETNDRSAIYEKTFPARTGRYLQLCIDSAEADSNNKRGHVRLYGLSLSMLNTDESGGDNTGEVTFDDIIAIAPFAKKETLDKLVDKLIATDDLNKIKSLAPFLSEETLNKLISKVSSRADITTIRSLAPFLSRATLDRLVDELDGDMDFEKIKSLAPFLSREALAKCVVRNGGKIDMKRLRSLAPFLGSDCIDEIISKML
ncbi:MAG: discoidin domain-containing protein [Oscillospiraceae bacterium]|nr:discoidin domain-containing protein [Oscillospiraceae bacterium]